MHYPRHRMLRPSSRSWTRRFRLDRLSQAAPWYVMPLATEIRESLKGAMLVQKVGAIRQISTTLAAMARLDPPVRHRDVKLAKPLQLPGLVVVGDFGVAKRPTDEDMSGGRAVGPWRHLPSEVFVGDGEPDPERVDVHCLALRLWQHATDRRDPPEARLLPAGSTTSRATRPRTTRAS